MLSVCDLKQHGAVLLVKVQLSMSTIPEAVNAKV